MPRIEAESIEAHVEAQTQRILDAAMRLFTERGYGGTDLRDIGEAVGLARNSLYRYYSGKDQILLACLHREMAPTLARMDQLDAEIPNAQLRIYAWVQEQLDIAATSCHGAMQMVEGLQHLSPEFRQEISKLHEPSARTLKRAVRELLAGSGRDAALVSSLITSMLRTSAAAVMNGGNRKKIQSELQTAVNAVLQAGPA